MISMRHVSVFTKNGLKITQSPCLDEMMNKWRLKTRKSRHALGAFPFTFSLIKALITVTRFLRIEIINAMRVEMLKNWVITVPNFQLTGVRSFRNCL